MRVWNLWVRLVKSKSMGGKLIVEGSWPINQLLIAETLWMIVDKIWKLTNVARLDSLLGPHSHRDKPLSRIMCVPIPPLSRCVHSMNILTTCCFPWICFFEKLVQYHGHDSQSRTQWVLNKSNTFELLLHLQHLIPCPSLPTINHVDKRPLLITVLLISTGFDDVKITTVYKHPGVWL